MPMLNWCYGAKTPDLEQRVSDAIFAAHRYRNKLCELELAKRERHYDLLRRLAPAFVAAELAVQACEAQLAAARVAIQAQRVAQRTKTPRGVTELVRQSTDAKAALRDLRATLKAAKLAAYSEPAVIAAMAANADEHKSACKTAKTESGLYWGTEAIVKMACASFASGAPPRFKRYEGEGQLAVQLQGGLDCLDALGYNTLCYLANIDGKRADCMIRIASEDGSPVFARVPIVFHRDLPTGKIKWAYLERRKIADHVRWTVRLTIDVTREHSPTLPGEVAIHTGWRSESNGLRVATWLGSDGQQGCLRLSQEHCEDYSKLDTVKSQRDRGFNDAIVLLQWWSRDRELPECLAEVRPHLHLWKSNARLAKLVLHWRDNRIDGDATAFDELNAWRKSDKQLWQHERRLAVRIVRRRNDLFRNFAAQMARQYGVAIVSPIDAKDLTENSTPEELETDNTQAHRHAKWAAVSTLTQMIREKFPLHCIDVDPRNITRQCCNCGEVNARPSGRRLQCRECGVTTDVDANAVANTLARGEAAVTSGALLELATAQELKDAAAAEKLANMQAANRTARETRRIANDLQGQIG